MAKQKEGVYEKVIACAKEEFLEKGYVEASLRTIAAKAGTSTNSIYVRFQDKEGLFGAIVEPVSEEYIRRFDKIQEDFSGFDREFQTENVGEYSSEKMLDLIDYVYDNFDVFRILINASYGTKYMGFIDRLVELEEEYTWRWLEAVDGGKSLSENLTRECYHMVVTAYFDGVFEVVRHSMSREDAKKYVSIMGKYHRAGFMAISENCF